jgi:hypothetical protein
LLALAAKAASRFACHRTPKRWREFPCLLVSRIINAPLHHEPGSFHLHSRPHPSLLGAGLRLDARVRSALFATMLFVAYLLLYSLTHLPAGLNGPANPSNPSEK